MQRCTMQKTWRCAMYQGTDLERRTTGAALDSRRESIKLTACGWTLLIVELRRPHPLYVVSGRHHPYQLLRDSSKRLPSWRHETHDRRQGSRGSTRTMEKQKQREISKWHLLMGFWREMDV